MCVASAECGHALSWREQRLLQMHMRELRLGGRPFARRLPTGDRAIGRSGSRDHSGTVLSVPGAWPNCQETDMTSQTTKTLISVLTLAAGLTTSVAAQAQATPSAADAASAASAAEKGNKAGKPPADAAASQSDVATKKPAKPGAQSGQASAPKK
jgi:hypothetical protein